MSKHSIRFGAPKGDADWAAIDALMTASFAPHERTPIAELRPWVAEGSNSIDCAFSAGRLVGFCVLWERTNSNYVLLSYVAVDAALHGRGIGTALCQRAVDRFHRVCGAPYLVLEGMEKAVPLYRRLKFQDLPCAYRTPVAGGEPASYTLMAGNRGGRRKSISIRDARIFTKHLLSQGYALAEDDPLVREVLASYPAA